MEIKVQVEAGELFNVKNIENEVSSLVKNTLYGIETEAKRNCPVDTGRLRGSITTNIIDDMSGEVGTNVSYCEYVEYGTRYQEAQPYFEPAVKKTRDKLDKELDKLIERIIK